MTPRGLVGFFALSILFFGSFCEAVPASSIAAPAEVPVVPDIVLRPILLRRFLILAISCLALSLVIGYAHADLEEERLFRRNMASVIVRAPEGAPLPSQESIDLAIEMYGIIVPPSAGFPVFDPHLEDRGLTSRATFMDRAKVSIGPAAFTSWALLGSTLAHEIEVHCYQSFAAIWLLDILKLDGVTVAERAAYAHEIAGAHRFGLGPADVQLIGDTVEFYYPEASEKKERLAGTLKSWLARNFLSARKAL